MKNLEDEIRAIAKDEAEKAQKEVVFPDIQKVEVTNYPEQKAPIVKVPAPIVKVPAPIVNVEAPNVNVEKPDLSEIVSGLAKLSEQLTELNKKETEPFNYKEFERIAKDNNTQYRGGGIGPNKVHLKDANGVVITPATEATQAGEFATLSDSITTTDVTYVGKAAIGSASSGAVWQIKKLDESGTPTNLVVKWADGDAKYDNIWDNRASLSYS